LAQIKQIHLLEKDIAIKKERMRPFIYKIMG